MIFFLFLFLCITSISHTHSMELPPAQSQNVNSLAAEKKENIFDIIKRERLITYLNDTSKNESDEIAEEMPDLTENNESMSEYVKARLEEQLNPPASLKLRKTCALLKKSQYWPQTDCSFDAYTLDDLKLLKGNHDTPTQCLVEKIKTETTVGHVTTCAQLLHPLTDHKDLYDRRDKVEKLCAVYQGLKPLLSQTGNTENAFLSFFQLQGSEDDFFTFVLQSEQAKLPFAKKNKIITDLQNAWNTSETCILVQTLYPHIIQSISLMNDGTNNCYKWAHGEIKTEEQYVKMFAEMGLDLTPPITSPEGIIHRTVKLFAPEKWAQFLGYGLNTFYYGRQIATTNVHEMMQARLTAVTCMQKKLIGLNAFIKNSQQISSMLEETKDPVLQDIAKKLQLPHTPKIEELKASLATSTFQEKESCWSHWGRIKATYRLLNENECKKELLPLFAAMGELDFLSSAARLAASDKSPFCMPIFFSNDEPGITICDCWNIFRDPAVSVKNTIGLGSVISTEQHPRSLVITGPNGKGKTENMLAQMYAAIMAQSLCVAPGSLMFIVPCKQFITRLKTETNTSRDRSLFMADAERMGTILKKIEEEKGITFVMLDEPANGTKSKLARSLVKVLLEEIAQNKNTLCLTTTHLDRPTTLAEKNSALFANYKAVDGYKLAPGVGSFEKEEAGIAIIEKHLNKRIVEKVKQDMYESDNVFLTI